MRVPTPPSETDFLQCTPLALPEQKVQHKLSLQREIGWPQEPRKPLLCLPGGMTDALGGALLLSVLPGIVSLPIELLILGKGAKSYGSLFTKLAKEQRHCIAIVPFEEPMVERMFAAADIALFFTEPTKLPELRICQRYGVIPIAPEVPALENYDPVQESGDAFLYPAHSGQAPWHLFAALVRALETFKLPFDWRTIQRHGMEKVRRT